MSHTISIDLDGVAYSVFSPKVLGHKGEYLFHIQDQTGVMVALKGDKGDGNMDILLVAADEDSMDRAAAMCDDLIGTLFDEFEDWREQSHGGGCTEADL